MEAGVAQSVQRWVEGRGLDSWQRQTDSRANAESDQTGTGTSFLGEKKPERETDHSPPPSDEVKKGGATPPLHHTSSQYSAELLN
jgi:hypothetical protein